MLFFHSMFESWSFVFETPFLPMDFLRFSHEKLFHPLIFGQLGSTSLTTLQQNQVKIPKGQYTAIRNLCSHGHRGVNDEWGKCTKHEQRIQYRTKK